MDVICPATDKDLKKYEKQYIYTALETAEFYQSVFFVFFYLLFS